jgi:hypothetical protein
MAHAPRLLVSAILYPTGISGVVCEGNMAAASRHTADASRISITWGWVLLLEGSAPLLRAPLYKS